MGESSLTAQLVVTVFVAIAAYEWVAVKTRRVPTITDIVKSAGWPARIVVGVGGALALFDHFVTGWVL
jgi:hypothetical protein